MRKFLFSLLFLTFCVTPLHSQNGVWMFETHVGVPFFDRLDINTQGLSANAEIVSSEREHTSYGKSMRYDNEPVILPVVSLTSGYRFRNVPLSVHLSVSTSYAFNILNGGPNQMLESEVIFHIMPQIRLYYTREPVLNFFGSVAAGIRARYYAETLEGDTVNASDYRFTWQVSPFGMELGKSWYFSFSFGYGQAWMPVILGVGYRFPQL